MVFPFDVRAAMTTALASRWAGDGGGIRRGRPQIQAPQLFFVPQVQQASAQRGRGETPARQQTGRGLRHGLAVSGADGDRRQPAPLVKQDQPVAHGNRGGVSQAGFPAPHQAAGLHLHAPQAAADRAEPIHVAVPADEVVVVAVQHLLVAPPQFLIVHSSTVGGGITKGPPRPTGVRPRALNHLVVAVAIEQHQRAAAHHRRGIAGPQGTRPTHGRPRVGPLDQHIRLPRHAVVVRPEEPGPARGAIAARAVSRRGGRRRRRHTAPERHATFGGRCRRAVTTGAGDHQAAQQRPPKTGRGCDASVHVPRLPAGPLQPVALRRVRGAVPEPGSRGVQPFRGPSRVYPQRVRRQQVTARRRLELTKGSHRPRVRGAECPHGYGGRAP